MAADIPDSVALPGAAAAEEDLRTIAGLRAGDESVFASLVDRHAHALQRLAFTYVRDRAVAEEVVQEAWIGLLQSIHRFEGRSSLKTWLYRILINCARTRARKESRSVAFSSLGDFGADAPAVEAGRFQQAGDAEPGAWASPPGAWRETPEASLLSSETRLRVAEAVAALPDAQRIVITLRDIEGATPEEVCNLLELTDTNQRVLLHRARAKVRRALEAYFEEDI